MVTTTMRPVKVLREQNKKGVRFSKVDNQDIDFVAEEKKSQRRWSIVKVEKERKKKMDREKQILYAQLTDPTNVGTIMEWSNHFIFQTTLNEFFQHANVPGASMNDLQTNLAALRNIEFSSLDIIYAHAMLNIMITYMKDLAGWSTARLVTPTNSPKNPPGPDGNHGGGDGGAGNTFGGGNGAWAPDVVGGE
mmetsp:Transcript_26899/g.48916  ORF Transcript_26899/g.48916 Transcript_26899/m.48916 type:complete len:192 (-) Transcript_26899:448-1023(-)|eukprot:CAMPEP_0198296696 /NCGR_PEP_ID=MMETSP1449-20131203/33575_1 /TAXON_ID=420275 /ORGANISM="Attheya septentrionalis, Strain CCMP2084" /LENGTH=191 /DNA_ID=CAMNT_0043997377 /DNA_START=220 /DNA_END=795 /DNA_ORIENTATION=+